jgi:hypothetical protein
MKQFAFEHPWLTVFTIIVAMTIVDHWVCGVVNLVEALGKK